MVTFAGCGKDDNGGDDPAAKPSLEVSPATIPAELTAGNYSIAVTSNIDWTVASSVAWCTPSPVSGNGNGTITVGVTENDSEEERVATITVTAGALTKPVTLTQKGYLPELRLLPTTVEAGYNGGRYDISVTTREADWTAEVTTSSATWCEVSPTWSAGEGTGTATVDVVAPNPESEPRVATITFTAGTRTQAVTVTQEALPTPPVNTASTQTWTFGESPLVWSDAINIAECESGINNTSAISWSDPQCGIQQVNGKTWYFYNWAYLDANREEFCPDPWRLPNLNDITALASSAVSATDLHDVWGASAAVWWWGEGINLTLENQTDSHYHTGIADTYEENPAMWVLHLVPAWNPSITPDGHPWTLDGAYAARCVRD